MSEMENIFKQRMEENQIKSEKVFLPIIEGIEAVNAIILEKYGIGPNDYPEEFIKDSMPCIVCDGEITFEVHKNRHIWGKCSKCSLNWIM